MAIKPILFNTEMVRAILDGRKTQTRRIVRGIEGLNVYRVEPAEEAYENLGEWDFFHGYISDGCAMDFIEGVKAPAAIGDVLWVRETWGRLTECNVFPPYEPEQEKYIYKADIGSDPDTFQARWKPCIHMPRDAARIFLKVKYVYPELLQDMSEESAIAEGIPDAPAGEPSPLERFSELWDTTIKRDDLRKYGWHANPYVWRIEFERCEKPEGWCE